MVQQSAEEEEFKGLVAFFAIRFSVGNFIGCQDFSRGRLYREASFKMPRVYGGGNVQIDRRSESVERVSLLFTSLADKLCPFN